MLTQLIERLNGLIGEYRPHLAAARRAIADLARVLWRIVRPPLLGALQIAAALIILFEEWGWRPLAAALAQLARFRPWAELELWIAGLPPYGALAVFALPTTILFPLKFVAVFLLANGYLTTAAALFIGAKITSTALIARIFMLTKPALMQIRWFSRGYEWLTPWKEAVFAHIRSSWVWRWGRMVKTRIRLETKRAWARSKPVLDEVWAQWAPRLRGFLDAVRPWLASHWRLLRQQVLDAVRSIPLRVSSAAKRYLGHSK